MNISLKNVYKKFPVTGGWKIAVDNVSLDIDLGERLGIIGRNGAGKTTLLQIIAGLAEATSGEVNVDGHVNCIMTLGVGLREELSGRDNIYIDGEINGKARKEVDRVIDDIIAFADIGEFIDYPVRTYSTGMKARLAFSMIIFIEPGVLIIDEALSAGDAEFGAKAAQKMKEICGKGKILILVSHSMKAITDMCGRCIWMDQGRVVMDGDSESVTKAYQQAVREADEREMQELFHKRIGPKSFDPRYSIDRIEFLDKNNIARRIWQSDEEMTIRLFIKAMEKLECPDLKISIERTDGNVLMENYASRDGFRLPAIEDEAVFEIDFGAISFGQNTYEVHVELLDMGRGPQAVLTACDDVIKVEKPLNIIDSPSYFCPIEWSSERMRGTD
ncbi:MAG: ATP-binding cassette domain-containing protein [Nitrospirae bacterium]|nr:ATP-binding cassette domain-containing protein [Nitrospirota bacterium]